MTAWWWYLSSSSCSGGSSWEGHLQRLIVIDLQRLIGLSSTRTAVSAAKVFHPKARILALHNCNAAAEAFTKSLFFLHVSPRSSHVLEQSAQSLGMLLYTPEPYKVM